MAITTTMASAIQPPALNPNAVGSATSGASAATAAAARMMLDIELSLHRRGGVLVINPDPGQSSDHVLGRFGRHGFDLGARRDHSIADLPLGGFDLHADLV